MSPLSGYNLKRYSGQVRAAYSYQYDGSDGKAWTDGGFAQIGTTEGFLIEKTPQNDKYYGAFQWKNSIVRVEQTRASCFINGTIMNHGTQVRQLVISSHIRRT